MKQKPWAEDFSKGVAKAYKQGCDDTLKQYGSILMQLYKLGSQIMQLTAAYQPPKTLGVNATNISAGEVAIVHIGTPAAKRGPVKATEQHIMAAAEVLYNTKPPYSALSPRNVAAVWPIAGAGPKLAGAALKTLVAQGKATVKRGKYAQAQPEVQTADGAISEAP